MRTCAPSWSPARACSASPTWRHLRDAWWLALLPSDRLLSPHVGERDDEDRDEQQHLDKAEHAHLLAERPGGVRQLVVEDRPRVHERCFDVEDQEQDCDLVEPYRVA